MYQLTAFKSEVRLDVFVTGKTYTAIALVITLCNLVVINVVEEHPASILTFTMKIKAVYVPFKVWYQQTKFHSIITQRMR
jgi:hypothetical protein